MPIEGTLYTRLTTHAGLSALIVDRVFPNHLPQDVTYPAISYRRVTAPRVSNYGSDAGIVRARFQIDVWASSYDSASAVREQVRLALQRWSNTAGTVVQDTFFLDDQELYEDDIDVHHFPLDFEIIYEE